MSFDKFKHSIKGLTKEELLEIYYSNNREIEKTKITWNKNRKAIGTKGDKDYSPGLLRSLKRKRAILLTLLNQKGWNGKQFGGNL